MGDHPWGYGGGMREMGVPLIPAPMAFFALLVGLMIGVMIGKKKSMMHGMGPGMMHGMGSEMGCGPQQGMMPGMGMGMGAESGQGWEDWAKRKKMMKKMMMAHHHHGDGAPGCRCDEGQSAMSKSDEGMSE
jgi:hypothetical protein